MLVKILGTKGEIKANAEGHLKQSGVLIDNKLLLDVGEQEYLSYHPKAILVTHLHPDHAFFVSESEGVNISVPVFAPESSKKQAVTVLSAPCEIAGYKVTPVPTIHSVHVKSQGYVVEKGTKRIFYSGDMVDIEPKYRRLLGRLDMVITEGSFIRKGGLVRKNIEGKMFGHAGVPDLIGLFSKFTSHIVFTHFGTWFMRNTSKARDKIGSFTKKGLKVDIAFDGAEYCV